MMKKEEKEHAKIHGIIQALREFVKALVDMERKGEVERIGHGEITGFGLLRNRAIVQRLK